MQETAEQYKARILGYLQGKKPMTILTSTPRVIERLVNNVPARTLKIRPESDKWSATEILVHLADSELVFAFRMRLVLGSTGVAIQSFDQDDWAIYSKYRQSEPCKSLRRFKVLREANVELLKTIPNEMWEHYGVHSERGNESIVRMTEMFAGHDLNHLTQLRAHVKRSRPTKKL